MHHKKGSANRRKESLCALRAYQDKGKYEKRCKTILVPESKLRYFLYGFSRKAADDDDGTGEI